MTTLPRVALLLAVAGEVTAHKQTLRREERGRFATASHRFTPYEAEVIWMPHGANTQQTSFLELASNTEQQTVRILHVTDNHISLDDTDAPRTTRMYNAFSHTSDFKSKQATTPKDEFTALLRRARKEKVDLIALGGDLINYPSPKTVAWSLQQLRDEAGEIPFIYTAGNHDWHEEGIPTDTRYDSARMTQLNSTLRPLFEHSAATADRAGGPGAGTLYGKHHVKGVDVFFVDNSNHQVSEEQLNYLKGQLQHGSSAPAVLMLHMPLNLAEVPLLQPKYLCGHPGWGAATDELFEVEGRPRWPKEGNSPSTMAFIELVQRHSAPAGRLAALLTGHVHKDFTSHLEDRSLPNAANLTALSCGKSQPGCLMQTAMKGGSAEATGALQYTTLDAAEGGYRLLTIRNALPHI